MVNGDEVVWSYRGAGERLDQFSAHELAVRIHLLAADRERFATVNRLDS
jgi:hypothetical protein